MAKRRASRRKQKLQQLRRRALHICGHVLFWGLLLGLGYCLWLDREVARTFATHQWALPARVYAQPVTLFSGAAYSRAELMAELDALGYQRRSGPPQQGQYRAREKAIDVFTRGFPYWDAPEPARLIRISFNGKALAAVHGEHAENLPLVRLEPVEIGRINPQRFEDRVLLRFEDLPQQFIELLIAVEDRRFFQHHGFDPLGLMRAMWHNLRAGRMREGGSTITQQLVKNFYLTRERTLRRKMVELVMAISLELRFSKQDILETYINEVFLGQDGNRAIHGFGLAAQFYFARPLNELSVPQMATLIGMVKGPSAYDPRRHRRASKDRRNTVLAIAARNGLIAPQQAKQWQQQTLRLGEMTSAQTNSSAAFIDIVKRHLARDYSAEQLKTAGMRIFTTLDRRLQRATQAAVSDELKRIEQARDIDQLQAAVVLSDPGNGEILALVGDRYAGRVGFNRAYDIRRPVGSAIKPLVYALALSQPHQYTLASPLDDAAIKWQGPNGQVWQPKNFNGQEQGEVSMLNALEQSLNLASVDLGLKLGIPAVRKHLEGLGLSDDIPEVPSIVLGAVDLSPYELAQTYSVIANDGYWTPLRAIVDVTDAANNKLTRYPLEIEQRLDAATAAQVKFAMSRVVERGTARALRHAFADALPLAAKTGTSNNHRDSWFIGFGANRLATVWVGRDNNSPTGLTGSSGALPIWRALMQAARLEPLSSGLPPALTMRSVDLQQAVEVPPECANGQLIPVHNKAQLQRWNDCRGALTPAPRKPSMFDRFRSLFE